MNWLSAGAPPEAGAAGRAQRMRTFPPFGQGLLLLLCAAAANGADVSVLSGPWSRTLGASSLQAGAGTDLNSPVVSDVLVAVLAISNTGGGNWSLLIAREGNEAQWPSGVSIALKRSGGSAEAGISDGLAYQLVTNSPLPFCSGVGDYASVEIFLRLDGLTIATPPGFFSLSIRYSIEAP